MLEGWLDLVLLVDLLFAEEDVDLTEAGIVRSLYDPATGTGGMLALRRGTPARAESDARTLFGQECNPQSYAICKFALLTRIHVVRYVVSRQAPQA